MEICICGWYYHQPFFQEIEKVTDRFTVTVIAHRDGPAMDIRTVNRPNIGLDWGAYDFYLKNCWLGSSSVLFLQDDTEIDDIEELDRISSLDPDQIFIFRDENEAARNSYGHGRAFYCSQAFLFEVLVDGGFYYDAGNTGFVNPGHFLDTPPTEGCQHHNAGIHAFMKQIARIRTAKPTLKVFWAYYARGMRFGRRGIVSN